LSVSLRFVKLAALPLGAVALSPPHAASITALASENAMRVAAAEPYLATPWGRMPILMPDATEKGKPPICRSPLLGWCSCWHLRKPELQQT
jgi:hypothetical protein